jgi:hypothetical protein
MLHWLPGDSMGWLRLLGTRLRFLRFGLLALVRLRLRFWLLGLRGALLWRRLLSVLLRLLRMLLRLFLFPLVAAFVLSVKGQQRP